MRIYTTNPSVASKMRKSDYSNWLMMCLIHGCEDPGTDCKNCTTCGWNRIEERRRYYLPLVKGKNGLWHKDISMKVEEKNYDWK